MNGTIAGLAGVTPASGYIDSQATILLGLFLGFTTFGGSMAVKEKFGIDDALEVTTVHGLSGIIGSLSIGFLASKRVNPALELDGLFYGGSAKLLGIQALGVSVAVIWSGALTWILLKVIDKASTNGLRIPSSDEEVGLDISEHGETAYHELEVQQISQETAARMPSHFGVTATMKRRVSQYQRIEQERDEGSGDVALIGDIQ